MCLCYDGEVGHFYSSLILKLYTCIKYPLLLPIPILDLVHCDILYGFYGAKFTFIMYCNGKNNNILFKMADDYAHHDFCSIPAIWPWTISQDHSHLVIICIIGMRGRTFWYISLTFICYTPASSKPCGRVLVLDSWITDLGPGSIHLITYFYIHFYVWFIIKDCCEILLLLFELLLFSGHI